MIGLASGALMIFVALEPCDMRKSFNGLYAVVCRELETRQLTRDAVFVFVNKRRNRIKLLYWDGTGLWVAAKRLERGTFSWPRPRRPGQKKIQLTAEALQLIVDGVDLRGATLRPWYEREDE
jgi:transposase